MLNLIHFISHIWQIWLCYQIFHKLIISNHYGCSFYIFRLSITVIMCANLWHAFMPAADLPEYFLNYGYIYIFNYLNKLINEEFKIS